MARARNHAADRLLDSGPGHVTGADLPDLAEDEVFWSSVPRPADGRSSCRRPDLDRARRWVDRREGGLSQLPLQDGCAPRQSSAPVEVPVWPRFLRDESSAGPAGLFNREEEREEVEEGGWLPPHEYLAREKGRSVATSMLEGVGRTLKGRDMSRVRDAVWSRTGFFG